MSTTMTTDAPRSATGTAAPAPVQPLDGAQVNGSAAIFGWTPVRRARTYRLQIAADEAFQALLVDLPVERSTEITLYDLLPVDGRTLYWRVRAEAPQTDWSTPVRFVAGTAQARTTPAPATTSGRTPAPRPARAIPTAPGSTAPVQAPAAAVVAGDEPVPPYTYGVTSSREVLIAFLWMVLTIVGLALAIAPALP